MPGPRSAKKAQTPPKSAAKKAKGTKYEYTDLAKASLSSTAVVNVYGVVIDATFPYKQNKSLYVCSLKIVDPSLSSGSKGSDYANVVMYAQRFEDLPVVAKVGDIVRVHRANVRMYNNRRQFNVSMHWNGAYALFSTEKAGDFTPAQHSGEKSTIEKQDSTILGSLRKWATTYFEKSDGVSKDMYTPLKSVRSQKTDFDVVARIS